MADADDNAYRDYLSHLLVVIPALNEEASLRTLAASMREALPGVPVLVVNDGSTDNTGLLARELGACVLDMPHNVGVGCAMQAGYQYAARHGYEAVLRIDSDGQHPPAEAPKLIRRHLETGADLVVGTRYGERGRHISTAFREAGSHFLARFLSVICRTQVTDPTSGFWLVSSPLLHAFAREFPTDYPEPEGIALLRRLGYSYAEAPVAFRERRHGRSSIGFIDAIYFIVKVGIALVVDRVRRIDRRNERRHITHMLATYGGARTTGGCGTRVPWRQAQQAGGTPPAPPGQQADNSKGRSAAGRQEDAP